MQVKGKEPNCLALESLQAALTLATDRMSLFQEDKSVANALGREKKEKKKKVFWLHHQKYDHISICMHNMFNYCTAHIMAIGLFNQPARLDLLA